MNKTSIIQEIINTLKAKTYLEIGVFKGETFLQIRAPIRIAVDPTLLITKTQKLVEALKNKYFFLKNKRSLASYPIFDKYYEITSNEFFKTKKDLLEKHSLNVVLVDGSHAFEQSYIDVINSLKYLNDNGFIVMHDCNPISELMAFPVEYKENEDSFEKARRKIGKENIKYWSGDVWKTIVALNAIHDDLSITVLNCDFGVGIIRKGINENKIDLTYDEIKQLDYNYLNKNRKRILNLRSPNYLYEILKFI